MRKLIATILAATILLTALIGCKFTPKPNLDDIVILYTNDIHCATSSGLGFSGISTIKNTLISQGKSVLLADCGDAVQGEAIGTISSGEYIIDMMNEVGYDIAIPGNHEFDCGMSQFMQLLGLAEFPYICSNFVDNSEAAVLDTYTIKEINGVKIAFVGVITPKTITSSAPTNFQDEFGNYIYGFCQDETGEKVYSAVQSAVDSARNSGADYVIALAHLGIESDCSPWTSYEIINNTTGIDAMLDGHSHSVITEEAVKNKDEKPVILTSTGTKLANVGCLTFNADGTVSTTLINDSGMQDFVSAKESEFDELLNTVVASTSVTLTITDTTDESVRIIRNQETNLGDLCADAYRAISGADIALLNGGGIRESIPAGDITYGQILSVQPYGNEICVVEATGQEILDALEMGARFLPEENGGFLQVSGLSYEIDTRVKSTVTTDADNMFSGITGKRRVKNVMVGESPIDPDKSYTVVSHNFLLKSGGDGYIMFTDNTLLQDCVMVDNQVLITYITNNLGGTVGEGYDKPYGDGRITIIK